MEMQLDFSIYDQDGNLAAVAEAKKKPGITRTWATNWARNFLAHGRLASPAYLLLVTPEHVYLWKRPAESGLMDPTYILDSKVLLRSYLAKPEADPERISAQAFELLVESWLYDLIRPVGSSPTDDEAEPLVESGFLEAVKQGRIESNQPV